MTNQEQFRCPAYKKCGGCQLDVTYKQQLSFKQRTVIRLVGRYARVAPILGMKEPLGYRCKVSNAFGYTRGQVISGVWQSSSHRIAKVDTCALEDGRAAPIFAAIRRLLPTFKLKTYDEETRSGYLRFVTVRIGKATGEILVALGTADGAFPAEKNFVQALVKACPGITTVTRNVSVGRLNLLLGEKETVLYGDGHITDRLCGCDFRISARSFFQVNPTQTEVLYRTAVDFAALTGNERVIDAYSGVGTIGMIAAARAGEVLSVEQNASAVENAIENVRLNGLSNVRVVCEDAGAFMTELARHGESADVVFTDPPRQGCSKEFLRALVTLAPSRIVYVSCDPESLSRDLYFLTKNGYRAEKIQPVDMFPYTRHVETVVQLKKETVHD